LASSPRLYLGIDCVRLIQCPRVTPFTGWRGCKRFACWQAGAGVLATGAFSEGAALLDGLTLLGADAWGKYLFCNFDSGDVPHVQLGLIGKFRALKAPIPDPVGAVRLRLQNAAKARDFSGPARCDIISPIKQEQI